MKWSTFNGVLMPFSWYHLAITLTHENVRGPVTKYRYISLAIKMLWKGQKSTLRIFMAHWKFPVKGIILTHGFSIPLNYHEFAHHEKSGFSSYILSDSVWVNLSENMVCALIQSIRKAKRLFYVWVEHFDQSQHIHQKQPCFR